MPHTRRRALVLGVLAAASLVSATAGAVAPAGATQHAAAAATSARDWFAFHGTADHAGYAAAMPRAQGSARVVHSLTLDGEVDGSPIVIGTITIVATENDTVYAFDSKFRQVWKARLGDPSPAQDGACGHIDPLGILSTPVYDTATGLVYVSGEFDGKDRHQVVALAPRTGKVAFRRALDLPGMDPFATKNRGALAITGGRVWVPFGSKNSDCGNYKGRVVGVPVSGKGALVKYDPSTRKQGGIWNTAGGTVDAKGNLYVVAGNGSSFPGDAYDHTNSVDELNSSGKLIDSFAPTDWAQNNKGDVGLGSNGVALVGKSWAVLGGKSGPVYVLRQGKLGGIGGQASVRTVCQVYGGSAVVGSVVYLPCSDTGDTAVRVNPSGTLSILWRTRDNIHGSPVVGGDQVWALDQSAGRLYGLNPNTGAVVRSVAVGATSRFASPSITEGYVLVPTLTGLAVVRTS